MKIIRDTDNSVVTYITDNYRVVFHRLLDRTWHCIIVKGNHQYDSKSQASKLEAFKKARLNYNCMLFKNHL